MSRLRYRGMNTGATVSDNTISSTPNDVKDIEIKAPKELAL